jgi:C-terminal processing protease CtpA/Prc
MSRGFVSSWIGWVVGVLALAALAFVHFSQRQTISGLNSQMQVLQASADELDRLRAEYRELQQRLDQATNSPSREKTDGEVLRLRSEISRIREQLGETELLQVANAELLQLVQSLTLSSNQQAVVAMIRKKGAVLGLYCAAPGAVAGAPPNGAYVQGIDPNSPAAHSDLKVGDVILRVDGRAVENPARLQIEMLTRKPGESVALDVLRTGAVIRVHVATRDWPG